VKNASATYEACKKPNYEQHLNEMVKAAAIKGRFTADSLKAAEAKVKQMFEGKEEVEKRYKEMEQISQSFENEKSTYGHDPFACFYAALLSLKTKATKYF
jgi:hypothetical protein